MLKTAEMTGFKFNFTRYSSLHFTGEVDTFVTFWCEIFSVSFVPEIIKIGSF